MKKCALIVFALTLLGYFTCSTLTVGTTDETSSGVSLFKPDGTPAAGALVQFFIVGDTTTQFVHQTQTDHTGEFQVKGEPLASGYFNVWAHLGDSLVAIQDSVYISTSEHFVEDDTLDAPGSISGIIGLQPNHDPRTVTVQALGTHIFDNVDVEGKFHLPKMAAGEYVLRISTDLAEYTDTFANVMVMSGVADTLQDTLWLIYTGIPVVTGMSATYDTLHGIAILSWNNTEYTHFQDFLIYRDDFNAINLSPNPIASTSEIIFRDSIFKWVSPYNYHYKYRLKVRNNSQEIGKSYKFIEVKAISPIQVQTTFTFATLHMPTGIMMSAASINDSMQITCSFHNPTRKNLKLSWAVEDINAITQVYMPDPPSQYGSDTLKYVWQKTGSFPIYIIAEDDGGAIWIDTSWVHIYLDPPVPTASVSTPIVAVNDTIRLQGTATDAYGHIVKWEWDCGNTGTFIETTPDSNLSIIAPSSSQSNYRCVLRVTDNDNNISFGTVTLKYICDGYLTDIDGNLYHTIKIGNQEWTMENLRTTKYNDGAPLRLSGLWEDWPSFTEGRFSYSLYMHPDSCIKYGFLYNWPAVATGKLAPEGWHVPTDDDWDTLVNYLISQGYNWDSTTTGNKIAKSLATPTGWYPSQILGSVGYNMEQNNRTLFCALAMLYLTEKGHWLSNLRHRTCGWWSGTIYGGNEANYRYIYFDSVNLIENKFDKRGGFSVRLVKDK